MKENKFYVAPEMELLPMHYFDMLCESPTIGGTEDYELINDFSW